MKILLKKSNNNKTNRKDYICTMENIETIKEELKKTRQNLNLTTDEYLIDSYIFQLSALNKKYQYYIKKAKQEGYTAF